MEWRGIFSHLYFFNTIIANDENDKQNFNTFYINFNPIFLQLNLNPIEFNSQIQSNVFEFNLVIFNSTKFGLKSIQVICNEIQYFHQFIIHMFQGTTQSPNFLEL